MVPLATNGQRPAEEGVCIRGPVKSPHPPLDTISRTNYTMRNCAEGVGEHLAQSLGGEGGMLTC